MQLFTNLGLQNSSDLPEIFHLTPPPNQLSTFLRLAHFLEKLMWMDNFSGFPCLLASLSLASRKLSMGGKWRQSTGFPSPCAVNLLWAACVPWQKATATVGGWRIWDILSLWILVISYSHCPFSSTGSESLLLPAPGFCPLPSVSPPQPPHLNQHNLRRVYL